MTYEVQDRGPPPSTLDGHDPQTAAATRSRRPGRYARRVVAIADRIATRDVELLTRKILSVQTFRERSPLAALRPYLTCCWVQRIPADASPYLHHTVPNGSAELVYTAGLPVRLVGPRTGPTREILPPGTTVVGIRLRPWAGHRVLGVPASELVDLSIDAADLLGRSAVVVGEKLSSIVSPWVMTLALEDLVVRRLADAPGLDRVAVEAVRRLMPGGVPGGAANVTSLGPDLGVSERQLRRLCQSEIGLPPKTLHRMLRYQGFLALATRRERPSAQLSRLATEAGYADQAHLTRESARLTGRTPRAVLIGVERQDGCAHDHTASYGHLLRRSPGR
jgi:AraC-like DNA-binding protein